MQYCEKCKNKKICKENSWVVTMDRRRKINGIYICDNFEGIEFQESKIFKFNDCDTVYIPKGYTLQQAIDWYTSEYDSIDYDELAEVDYSNVFWDCDVPKEEAEKIYSENPSNFNMWNLDKNGQIKEGTIGYRHGDLFIFKTFKKAKEEKDKEEADIFVICSTEF